MPSASDSDGHGRERGGTEQRAAGVADVLHGPFDRSPSPHGARRLLDESDVAEVASGADEGLLGRQPPIDPEPGLLGEMEVDFSLEVAFVLRALQERAVRRATTSGPTRTSLASGRTHHTRDGLHHARPPRLLGL